MRAAVLTEHPVFLERVAAALDAAVAVAGERQRPLTPFDSVTVPNQSLHAYVRRMGRRFRCGREVFTLALVYCERAAAGGIPFRDTSAHRLYLAALVLAAKFLEDGTPGNDFFAKCGGIPAKEMCLLEHQCLEALGYRLHVHRDCFEACDAALAEGNCKPEAVLAALADAAAAKGLSMEDAEQGSRNFVRDDVDRVIEATLPLDCFSEACLETSMPSVKNSTPASLKPVLQKSMETQRAGTGGCLGDTAALRRRHRPGRRCTNNFRGA